MQKLYIALIGAAGAGKSTASRILVDGSYAEVIPFAKPLKKMAEALGIPHESIYGDDKEKPLEMLGGRSARHALQTLGTEWGRNCMGPTFWVDLWKHNAISSREGIVVADDVRFENEANAIRSLGGIIIRIARPAGGLRIVPKHASENWEALPFDIEIVNDGSIADLRSKLMSALAGHLNRSSGRLAS